MWCNALESVCVLKGAVSAPLAQLMAGEYTGWTAPVDVLPCAAGCCRVQRYFLVCWPAV